MTKSKSEIRQAAKSAVKALTIEQRQVKSALIFSHIASLPEVKSAKTIALYHALPDEVIT